VGNSVPVKTDNSDKFATFQPKKASASAMQITLSAQSGDIISHKVTPGYGFPTLILISKTR